MKSSLAAKLDQLTTRRAELERLLSDPQATADLDRYRSLTREHSELGPLVESHALYRAALADEHAAGELQNDPEMKAFAEEELADARARIAALDVTLQRLLLPKDEDDARPMFLEIRAGTGGDESALFAGDLLRMYLRYAERQRWQVEIVSSSPAELGGYKEVIVRIAPGSNSNVDVLAPYARLKFESGGHRVQRVPVTETQGRIHTSACTLAVMPEPDDIADVDIRPDEIRIDTFRASGAGGQHINKTDSAVRITHLPTGIVVECQDDRSQHKNKAQALKVLSARIKDKQLREQQATEAATRRTLVGSGDRSERIRTYNFPQGRVTDHRINLTLYKLEFILDGDLDELTDALVAEHQAELLAALGDT
jgi:peptide chain release factor 1